MLTLPRTAEYALRAVSYIAEHGAEGPVSVSAIAEALGARCTPAKPFTAKALVEAVENVLRAPM